MDILSELGKLGIVPVIKIENSRDAELRECFTACCASQSNRPSFRATSASSIMPIKKK
jgi:hypothetical protein